MLRKYDLVVNSVGPKVRAPQFMNTITLSLKPSGFIFLLCEKGAGVVLVLCRVFGKIKTCIHVFVFIHNVRA